MKAIVYHEYGSPDVLRYSDVAVPVPADDQVLVKVHAAALNTADTYMVRGKPFMVRFDFGLTKPKHAIPGCDFAGVVEAVGKAVTRFKVGDAVYGDLASSGLGAFAEYVAVPEKILTAKPANLSFEQTAALPMAAVTALQGLRMGKIQSGEQVLIQGASGGVGTFALQLARLSGAEVTAVCSTGKIDLVRSLGAQHVIDYTRENVTQGSKRYDLIIAANGYHPLRDYRRILNAGGRYVVTGGALKQIFEGMLLGAVFSAVGNQKFGTLMAKSDAADLRHIAELVEAGKLTPVIDRVLPLADAATAFRYLEERHARGKVVLQVVG